MTDERDIPRWHYRFDAFSRAFPLLRDALDTLHEREVNELEREGIIQRFEYNWELAWKLIADYLAYEGVVVSPAGPRQVLKVAYEMGYIANGPQWMQALDARNKMSHTYSFATFEQVLRDLRETYFGLLDTLYDVFLERIVTARSLR